MSTAILRIYAPLSDRRKRQTFREAGQEIAMRIDWVAVNGAKRHLKPSELDAEYIDIAVPIPRCDCPACLLEEGTIGC